MRRARCVVESAVVRVPTLAHIWPMSCEWTLESSDPRLTLTRAMRSGRTRDRFHAGSQRSTLSVALYHGEIVRERAQWLRASVRCAVR